MNGLLFPGQGSQCIGMGKSVYNKMPSAAALLDKANELLGYDLKSILFDGPTDILTDTQFAQPAIYTCSAMYLEMAKKKEIDFDYVAGHSLGEYVALLAAGVIDFETGLKLVAARGKAMSEMNGRGTMAAVMGLNEQELLPYLTNGVVMANLNSKTQIVVSGIEDAIDEVIQSLAKKDTTVKVKKLDVSAAFHSPQMLAASQRMKPLIEQTHFSAPRAFVVSNVTGRATKDIDEIKRNLVAQITGQVRWYDTIITMKEAGVSKLYEIGYGDVLSKLNKTITFRPKCCCLEV